MYDANQHVVATSSFSAVNASASELTGLHESNHGNHIMSMTEASLLFYITNRLTSTNGSVILKPLFPLQPPEKDPPAPPPQVSPSTVYTGPQ